MQLIKEAMQYWWAILIIIAICWPGIRKMIRTGQKPFKERQLSTSHQEEGEEYEPGMEATLGALPVNRND